MTPSIRHFAIGTFVGATSRRARRAILRPLGRGELNEVDLLATLGASLGSRRTMVDVGARYGTALAPFARSGYRVIAFEPDPQNRKVLGYVRRWLPGVVVDPRALSDEPAEGVPFYVSPGQSSISSLLAFDRSHEPMGTVEVTTIDRAMAEYDASGIDVLKVDAEGSDLRVLRGLSWNGPYRPTLVMCEFDEAKVGAGGHRYEDIVELLRDEGYELLVSEWYPVREYGARHRWRSVDWYPTTLADARAHGNIVGIDARLGEHATVAPLVDAWRAGMEARS